ncbi:MAG: cytochrome c [Pseudomonadota bacterium]
MKTLAKLIIATGVALTPAALSAQDIGKSVAARKAAMQLYSFYLGQLGAMAKGETAYDAAAASNAAASLDALANLDGSRMWPPGSDNAALGDETRALPVIWTTYPAISERTAAFKAATASMKGAAGDGLGALQGAIAAVGKSCGGCHEDYRKPKE